MPADVFVEFVKQKLAEHGIEKVVPDGETLEQHARQVLARVMMNSELERVRADLEEAATATELPDDLREQVRATLRREPDLPWDIAVANIVSRFAR